MWISGENQYLSGGYRLIYMQKEKENGILIQNGDFFMEFYEEWG